jgi:CheY-like chemotaxis protein
VRVFQKAGSTLLTLINDLLDLSKVDSGRIILEEIDFELSEVMNAVVEIMSMRAKEKNIELSLQIAPEVPARLTGDPDRLRQVLINLVGNAIKFTAAGEVRVRVEPDPESAETSALRFSVSDTGIGIPPEKLDLIFEAFTQAHASTTRKYGGTGLGLAISHRRARGRGAGRWAASAPGARSTLYFPTRCGSAPQPAKHATPEHQLDRAHAVPPSSLSAARILVAEDSEENRFLIAEYLKDLGCHLDFAENGLVAVEKFCSGVYDLVFMDLQMPVLDGYGAAHRIRGWEEEQKRGLTPIVALTASALETDLQRALDAGCTAYLRKPVRLLTLVDAVGKYAVKAGPGPHKTLVRADARLRAVIPGYLDNRRGDVRTILEALAVSDYAIIRELGHKMSGTGSGYGFSRITEIGAAMEKAAKEQNAAEIRSWVNELSRYIERVEII